MTIDTKELLKYADILNASIAVINILLTLFLTYANYRFLNISKKREMCVDSYLNYYIPIQIRLIDFVIIINEVKKDNLSDVIFNPLREDNKKIRDHYITQCEEFIKFFDSLEKKSINKSIDDELIILFKHMKFIVQTKNSRLDYNEYSEYKDNYPIPDYQGLYDKIKEFRENKYINIFKKSFFKSGDDTIKKDGKIKY